MATVRIPTMRMRALGLELRKLREQVAGLTPQDAADQLGWSLSNLNRIENGRTSADPKKVGTACDLYGVAPDKRARLLQIAQEAQKRNWYLDFDDVFRGAFVAAEDAAETIFSWQNQFIPGLLQTQAYAHQLIRDGFPGDDEKIQRHLMARMARKTLLTRSDAPAFHAVLDEGALRREVGGRDVMREQLRALLEASKRENVTVQVMPFDAGSHEGMAGPFVHFSFPESPIPDVVYVEGMAGENYVERADQVAAIRLSGRRISDAALSEEESAALIVALIEE